MKFLRFNKNEINIFLRSLPAALKILGRNDPMRIAGATAFFTTFALPPIIFLLAQLFGLFIGSRNMSRGLLNSMADMLGEKGSRQMNEVIRSIRGFDDSWYVTLFVFIFLFFVATTLFIVIKNSMNQLWGIQIVSKPGFLFMLRLRIRSFAVIVLVGILFFAELLLESLETLLGNSIDDIWEGGGAYFTSVLNEVVSVLIIAAWFTVIFRFLADARPRWKACLLSGLLTGLLFTGGKLLLGILLIQSDVGRLYGSAGSMVLVLLFVFYSSFILYFGACFVVSYSRLKNWELKPDHEAFHVEQISPEKQDGK